MCLLGSKGGKMIIIVTLNLRLKPEADVIAVVEIILIKLNKSMNKWNSKCNFYIIVIFK